MKHIYRSFAAASILFLTAVLGTPTARTQTVAPMPAPTIIKTAPYTISASGFYQLGADLTYNGNGSDTDAIITINAPNVTIDFGGHYISGPSTNMATSLHGIYANGQGNLTIQNGTISHCFEGIFLIGSSSGTQTNFNQTIRNMLVTHCYYAGMNLVDPSTTQVNNCQVSYIGGTTVSGDTGLAFGIAIEGNVGPGCQVNNNTVTSVIGGATGGNGIVAFSAAITGNLVDTVSGGAGPVGIYGGNQVVGNRVSNCSNGIYSGGKYQNNLTYNCTTPFNGGTDAGGNN